MLELFARLREDFSISTLARSSIAIGIHKGGSTMLHDFLQVYLSLLSQAGHRIPSLDLSSSLFNAGYVDEQLDACDQIPRLMLSAQPCCYYGWRGIPLSFFGWKARLSHWPAVCLVRDPRDCVTSAYYSFLKGHVLPERLDSMASDRILAERQAFERLTIDEYVLANFYRFADELQRVAAFLHPGVKLYRYEDVWQQKTWFFADLIDHLQLPRDDSALATATKRVDIQPGHDPRGHVRIGVPGDHRDKLARETIHQLTSRYRPLLDLFSYA